MDKLRVGIIGTGRISDLHAIEYLANPRTEIVAVADAVVENARRRGQAWGVRNDHIFSSYHDLLALPDVDLVEILLPHHLHCQATIDAAAAGKHISVQKPMALSTAQAGDMIAAAKAAGVFFKVFENFIFYPPVQRAKALVDAGEIGDLLSIRIKSNAATSPNAWVVPPAAQAWRYDPTQNGGARWSLTTATTSLPLAGTSWARLKRCTPGSGPPKLRRAPCWTRHPSSPGNSPTAASARWKSSTRPSLSSIPNIMPRTTGSS